MTFDYAAFEAAEDLDERLKILGEGLTAFFRDFPDAEKVPLEQAGRNSNYFSRQEGLRVALNGIYCEVDKNTEGPQDIDPLARINITVQGRLATLQDIEEQLEPHCRRGRQGRALDIFNHLATAGQPDASYQRLVSLIGKRDEATGAVTFELPGFSPDELSREVSERMAQAHYSLATECAAMLYPDPIEAKRKAAKHIAAVRLYGDDYSRLKVRSVECSINALYQPACVIAARDTALAAMSATLGETGVNGNYYADRVKRFLNETGTTLTEVFAGGATIDGAQLSAGDCVTRFGIAVDNLNQASRVRAASGLRNG